MGRLVLKTLRPLCGYKCLGEGRFVVTVSFTTVRAINYVRRRRSGAVSVCELVGQNPKVGCRAVLIKLRLHEQFPFFIYSFKKHIHL